MPKRRNTSGLSPDRAARALSVLIDEGKLKLRDVTLALDRREKVVRELRERLSALGEEVSGAVTRVTRRRGRRPATSIRKPAKKTRRISKAQRAARQAQGRYLGAIRRLSVEARAKVKAIREKSGVRAAIAEAKRMARKGVPARSAKKRPPKSRPNKGSQTKLASKKETQPAAATG